MRQLVEAVFSAWQPAIEQALRALPPGDRGVRMRQRFGGALRGRPSQSAIDPWRQQARVARPQRPRVPARWAVDQRTGGRAWQGNPPAGGGRSL